jgi:glycosyltransferase involved in cell wall biosynthesis
MKTPVLIPAFNEARYIASTLESLPQDLTDPIVIVNGSTDNTAEIAASFGARVSVIDLTDQGKLPAIQHTLCSMGKRALEPLIILDGDTRPLAPRAWLNGMLRNLDTNDEEGPISTGGLVWLTGNGIVESSSRMLFSAIKAVKSQRTHEAIYSALYGPNMGVHFRDNKVLDAILGLDHYWPGEDRAIVHTIIEHGGVHRPSLHPGMLALSQISAAAIPFKNYFQYGLAEARKQALIVYAERGAEGSVPYIHPSEQLSPAKVLTV